MNVVSFKLVYREPLLPSFWSKLRIAVFIMGYLVLLIVYQYANWTEWHAIQPSLSLTHHVPIVVVTQGKPLWSMKVSVCYLCQCMHNTASPGESTLYLTILLLDPSLCFRAVRARMKTSTNSCATLRHHATQVDPPPWPQNKLRSRHSECGEWTMG